MATNPEVLKVLQSFQTLTSEDLRFINKALVDHLNYRSRVQATSFHYGDRVTWVGKHGTQTGTVQNVMQKNVRVKADSGMMWRVSATLLKKLPTT